MTEIKAHAEFSASGSERWLNCPASINLCKLAPEAPESEYAAEGTRAHECLEAMLKSNDGYNRGNLIKKYGLEMVEYAEDAAEWIIGQAGHDNELITETKVDASPFTCDEQFGTLDFAIIRDFGRLTVGDYKYGAGVAVDPTDENGDCNPQLAYYALGLSYQHDHNFSEVELVVIQPRAFHQSGETIRTAVFSIEQLLAWGEKFKAGVVRCKSEAPQYKSGKWCRFCKAAVICPELKDNSLKQAQIDFSDETALVIPEPSTMTIPNLGRALDASLKLEAFIDALRKHAEFVLSSGGKIDGWKLVEKRSPRRWADKEKSTAEAKEKFGEKAFTEPELLSPAQLEKAIGKKGVWSDRVNGWIDNNVTTKSSGLTLVEESDKRPAINPMENEFTNLEIE